MNITWSWQVLAVASAVFAAMTAILGKIGVAQINSDLATFVRTVHLLVTGSLLTMRDERQRPDAVKLAGLGLPRCLRHHSGLSWLRYFRAIPAYFSARAHSVTSSAPR